jgi:hypothetical protein
MGPDQSRLSIGRAALLIVAVDAVLLWPFAYRNGFGHHDIVDMQMDLFAPPGSASQMYGRSFSFAWYWFGALLRDGLALSPEAFPTVSNLVAVGGSTAADVFLLLALALAVPVDVALLSTLVWRFTPEVWEVGTYAHPWTFSLPIFFAATVVAARARRPISVLAAAALFFAAFAMRADLLLMVPVALAFAWLHRRDLFRPILLASSGGALVLLAAEAAIAGSQLVHLVGGSAGPSVSLRAWAVNLGVFGYGAGIASIAALLLGGTARLGARNARRELAVLTGALLPTLALWIPHGGAARHFGPVYLVLAVLVGYVIATRVRTPAFRAVTTAGLIAANALIAEGVLVVMARGPFQSIQPGESRRVIERVPLGNVWSNHFAMVRMNALEQAYVAWTLRCSEDASLAVGQESPYRLLMLASLKYGRRPVDGPDVYRFGGPSPHLWVADIPEESSPSRWVGIQALPDLRQREVVLLGPRIPGSFSAIWERQHAGIAAEETPATIEARPCPPAAVPATR